MLALINGYRAANGLTPLQMTQTLSNAAEFHSVDMASMNYFSHTLSSGLGWSENMTAFGYGYETSRAENIAAGNATAATTFQQWVTSPAHNANILNPNLSAIGIGRAYGAASDFGYYWTTTFGGVVDGAAC
ncbi:MAG TPA: CAP domain-containing protein [Thermomicrobiales bacterium]|nr:CAP domain-containing protein [Thermomicrobiales bacterium]